MLVCWTVYWLCSWAGVHQSLPPLPPPTAQPELSEVIAQRQQLPNSTYTFGPEDVLRITVYDHPDLSHEVTIAADGAFTYPLLGKFQAAGLTVQELEQRLTHRLADGYLVNPQLTVAVLQYRSHHVYVIGAVQKPGVYPTAQWSDVAGTHLASRWDYNRGRMVCPTRAPYRGHQQQSVHPTDRPGKPRGCAHRS